MFLPSHLYTGSGSATLTVAEQAGKLTEIRNSLNEHEH